MTMPAQPSAPAVTPATPTAAPSPAPATPTPPPASSTRKRSTIADREGALRSKLTNAPPPESAAATSDGEGSAPNAGADAAVVSGGEAPSAAAKAAAADRMARIEAYRAKERQADQERQLREQGSTRERETMSELEQLRARVKELQELDAAFTSEDSYLAYGEKRGYTPEKMIGYWRTKLSDPASVAAREARSVEERFQAELAKRDAQAKAEREAAEQRIADERDQVAAIQRAHQFLGLAQHRTESHPLTAQLLRRYGPNGVINFANHFVVPLVQSDDPNMLHDHVEQFLEEFQLGGMPAIDASSANGTSQTSPMNGAEQPITTLSNALTNERSAVSEEIPLHKRPLSEREALLRAQLARGG